MRWMGRTAMALMLAIASPAYAWIESMPGEEQWPEIPDRAGMTAFLGKWMPICNNEFYQDAGKMIVHDDGRITFARDKKWILRYRVIETTPHYVVTLVHSKDYGVHFWLFQPVGKLFQLRGTPEMERIGVNECPIFDNDARRAVKAGDAELAGIWKSSPLCHPSLTEKSEFHPSLGGRWSQDCNFGR